MVQMAYENVLFLANYNFLPMEQPLYILWSLLFSRICFLCAMKKHIILYDNITSILKTHVDVCLIHQAVNNFRTKVFMLYFH